MPSETPRTWTDQDRIVLWTCSCGHVRLMFDGDQRPMCSKCDSPMLTIPYIREIAVDAERERMLDLLERLVVTARYEPSELETACVDGWDMLAEYDRLPKEGS